MWLGKIELRQLPHLVGFNLVVALFSCTPNKFQWLFFFYWMINKTKNTHFSALGNLCELQYCKYWRDTCMFDDSFLSIKILIKLKHCSGKGSSQGRPLFSSIFYLPPPYNLADLGRIWSNFENQIVKKLSDRAK